MSEVGLLMQNQMSGRGIMVPERKGSRVFNRLPFISMVSPKERLGLNPIINRMVLKRIVPIKKINKMKKLSKKAIIFNKLFPHDIYRKLRTSEQFWKKNINPLANKSFNNNESVEKVREKLKKRIQDINSLKKMIKIKNKENSLNAKSLVLQTPRRLKPIRCHSYFDKGKIVFEQSNIDNSKVDNSKIDNSKVDNSIFGVKEVKTCRNNINRLNRSKIYKVYNRHYFFNKENEDKLNKINRSQDKQFIIKNNENMLKIKDDQKKEDKSKKKEDKKKEKEDKKNNKEEKKEIVDNKIDKEEQKNNEKKDEKIDDKIDNRDLLLDEDDLDEDINEVIKFLSELDYDKYCKDMAIREALSLLKARIEQEKGKEKENEKDNEKDKKEEKDKEANKEDTKENEEEEEEDNNETREGKIINMTEVNPQLNDQYDIINEEDLKKQEEIVKYKIAEQIAKTDKMKKIHSVNSIRKLLQREGLDKIKDMLPLRVNVSGKGPGNVSENETHD